MTGIAEAIAAISGIKTIADGLVAVRDESKVREIKLELMGQIFEIRQALDTLQDQIATVKAEKAQLQQENLELKKRLDAVDEYDLIELIGGVHVLAAKPVDGALHQPPYFCQACHSDGKKSALSLQAAVFDFDPASLRCPARREHSLDLPAGTSQQDIAHPLSK